MTDRRDDRQVRRLRLNVRLLAALAAVATAAGIGIFLYAGGEQRRMSREAVAAASKLRRAGETDLAVRHLSQHLTVWPADAAALELKSRILAETAQSVDQVYEAAKVHDQLLALAPDAPFSQEARRRLVALDVRFGDELRASPSTSQWMNEMVARASRYRAAEVVARQLITRGGREPGDYLLLAMALDGMAVPGDREAIRGAVEQYRNVLAMEPANLAAAERLSKLYQERLKDPSRAEQVLDELVKAAPRSVEARLARYRLFAKLRRHDKAAAELDEAAGLAPTEAELVSLLVASAEHALRKGDGGAARALVGRVPETSRDDPRVVMVRGLVEFEEEQPDEAIDAWRHGLEVAGGTDAEMTWWLAYALLQMNRVSDSVPLIRQYRRFVFDDAPMLRFLEALYYERTGRPARALATLESIHQRLDARYEGLIDLARGRCAEGLWDEVKALDAYTHALQLDPAAVVPRLALAKLKLRRNPEDAVAEIARGLRIDPQDPALRVAMAGARLRIEAARPAARRNWDEFDRDWHAAADKTPSSSALALMWADRLSLAGKEDEAVAFLEGAAAKSPRSAAVAVALANGFNRLGKPAKALEALDRAAGPGGAGDQAGLRIARATALTGLYRGRDARNALTADVDRLPPGEQTQVWMTAGQFDAARGDLEAARGDYRQWARLTPDDPRPWLVLLELELNRGDGPAIHTTVANLRRLAEDSRLTGKARELAADADLTLMIARAKERLWEADNPDPTAVLGPAPGRDKLDKDAQAARLDADRAKKVNEASALVDSVTFEAPELPAGQMLRARVMELKGDLDGAVAAYVKVWERGNGSALPKIVNLLGRRRRFDAITKLRESPEVSRTQLDLFSAQIFLRVGDRTQAGRIAEQLAQDLSNSGEALGWKARMLDHLGRLDDAENVLRALAERQPRDPEPWLSLIRFQAERKRTKAAAETAERARAAIRADRPEPIDARIAWAAGDKAAAVKVFAAAAGKYPDDVPVRLEAARFFEENHQLLEAEKYLRQARTLDPADRRVLRQLAEVLSSRASGAKDPQLWRKAWETLGPEGEGKSAEPDDRLARAVVLARAPEGAELPEDTKPTPAAGVPLSLRGRAIERLEALVADLPLGQTTATAARKFLTVLLTEPDQADRPRTEAERARQVEGAEQAIQPVAAAGTDPTAIALYAQVLIQSKKIDAAEWQLDRLAALSPGDPREAGLRARLVFDRARPVEAAEALEAAYHVREDDPGSESLGREAFALLAEGDPRDPSAQRLAESLARKNAACSWMPAHILARRGRADEAFELLKTAAAADARFDDVVQTGRVAMTIVSGSPDPVTAAKAEAVLKTLLRSEPDADVLNIMMAMLRHVQGDYEEEVRLYRKALERRPEDYAVLNNLAWALSEGLRRYGEALPFADRLVEVAPRDPLALDTRGVILTRLGRKDPEVLARALDDLRAVVKERPAPLHQLHLARALELAGKPDEARTLRETARLSGLSPRDVDPAERDEILAMLKP